MKGGGGDDQVKRAGQGDLFYIAGKKTEFVNTEFVNTAFADSKVFGKSLDKIRHEIIEDQTAYPDAAVEEFAGQQTGATADFQDAERLRLLVGVLDSHRQKPIRDPMLNDGLAIIAGRCPAKLSADELLVDFLHNER